MSATDEAAFLDTSALVRYLTDDPPALARRAAEIIDDERPCIVSELVLVEAAYVLTSVYRVSREATVDALAALVRRRNLDMLNLSKPVTLEALALCRDSRRVSFADAIQWAIARDCGPARIFSFDQRFPRKGIELLS